jgi:phenol 2-monooxygenase
LQDLLPADARFKVLIFTGDITDGGQRTRLQKLADDMEKPGTFLKRFSQGTENNEVFDMFAICSGKKEVVDFTQLPQLFRYHWSKYERFLFPGVRGD